MDERGEAMKGTVLIVEDNAVNMKLMKGLMDLLKCRVLEARDAETGLELLGSEHVDLVLLDIQLPGMDGISACRHIRSEMAREKLPVIAVSALAREEDISSAMEAGFDDYVTKPVDTRYFLELVAGWLSGDARKERLPRSVRGAATSLKKILVVDDNETNVKLLKSMLPGDLYQVTEAYSGQEALDAVATSLPDVIFLDIMMPDIDGFEVTRRLKSDPETDHIPIVLVTALDGMDERMQGFDLGAEDVLLKPVRPAEVIARARSMVRLSEYQKQLHIREQAMGYFEMQGAGDGQQKARRMQSILMVEDCKQDAHVFLVNLDAGDLNIDIAVDGKQALRYLDEKEYDLVLLDLVLPDMDGLAILRSVRSMDPHTMPQVVVVTAQDDLDTRLKGIEMGADDYLVKPVHPRELQARIRVQLRKREYIRALREGFDDVQRPGIVDDQTGVYSQAYMNRCLELEVKRSRRHRYPVSMVIARMVGFDGYKKKFGPLVGDLVLREVATILKSTFREIDLVARFGESGFAVILPYCTGDTTEEAVKRARQAVSSCSFPVDGGLAPGSVTITTGAAAYPEHASTAEDLVEKARKALERENQKPETAVN